MAKEIPDYLDCSFKDLIQLKFFMYFIDENVLLLSRDFLMLVIVAFIIAAPFAWYAVNQWLQDFAYRIDLEWWMFGLAGFLVMLLAYLSIGYQSTKAALVNPVDSLRSE